MKHVVITGSARGIGFGLAREFLAKDYKVTINGTSDHSVLKAIKELSDLYPKGKVQGFPANAANYDQLQSLWNKATEGFGEVDIWINNAGIGQGRKYTWDLSIAEIQNLLNINLEGAINGSLIAFKGMKEQGHGQIYNMEGFGSDGMMMEKMTLYGTSKRALTYFTKSLAKEIKDTGIHIGRLNPGMVITDLLLKPLEENPAEREKTKRIFNILADEVEDVTKFLVDGIIKNNRNNSYIIWLTKRKMIYRFIISPFIKRDLIK